MYHANEKVQFFQSESSFESQSNLSNSRYYDFTNEIISETQNVFLTLKKQLLPNEQLSQQDRVKYILSRAQIIYKDTIPQHLAYLDKIRAPANATSQVTNCSQKLKKLLNDYQNFKNGTLIYKQFFNLYGREFGYNPGEGNFAKGEKTLHIEQQSEPALKPQYIQINYNNDRGKLRATPRLLVTANNTNDKEVNSLREEIYLLKKNIEDMKKKHDLELTNQRLMVEKRIRTYMKVQSSGDNEFHNLKQELDVYSLKLSEAELQSRNLKLKLQQQNKAIELLKLDNATLKEEVEFLRKNDINQQEENIQDRSFASEMGDKDQRRAEKRLKVALQQNELLKNQLKSQRQRIYRLTSDLTEQDKKELQRLKKLTEKKTAQIEQLYGDLDKQRIQILQLNHNIKLTTKIQQSLKVENDQLKKQLKNSSNKEQKVAANVYPLPSSNELSQSLAMSRKLLVQQYDGEGIQGLPYYDILNKQFKIRFKRACLKDKQLLYKANGLEIGVISQFVKPNKIDILLHITNYGEQNFAKLKGKLMNANENKITGETFQFVEIASNDQVKIPVSLLINHYPLGPLILLLQYSSNKKEQLRILLPAHIFKMMEFQTRTHEFKNPERINLLTERKISKGLEEMQQYFKGGKVQKEALKVSAFHKHTHTEVLLQLRQIKQGFQLTYEHYQGNTYITDYFIKTLQFLLRK